MDKNRNSPSSNFHSLTFFAGLCAGLSPVVRAIAADNRSKKQEDTLIVEVAKPSLYAPAQSADPEFSRPVADTARAMMVISKQVIKGQGAASLTDTLKNVPGVGTFFAGENGNSSTGDTVYIRGTDTSNSIYIDGIRDIGNITRDTFNTEQVKVIRGPSGTNYGRNAPTGSINMVNRQPRTGSGIDASVNVGSAWLRRSTLDINQVIGEITAAHLSLMGEKTRDASRDSIKNGRYGVALSLVFGLGTENRLYLNYLHVTQYSTPDGDIPTIGLPGYSTPSVGTSAPNHSGKVDTYNFYDTNSDYDDLTTDTATIRFEHDLNDSTTVRDATRRSRIKQDYLMMAVMGGASNITQPTSSVDSWTWSCLANTKDANNKILVNQTNLASTFYTGSIGHDINTGVELTRKTQTDYSVVPITPPPVNIYHPDSNMNIGGLSRNDANTNGQTDTFGVYAFDTLQITREFELSGDIRLDDYRTEYNSATVCGASGCSAVACPTGVAKGSPITAADTAKSGNLMNWKAGVLYHLIDNGDVYIDYTVSQQPPGDSNFALAQSGSGSSADRTDFKPQKAKTSEVGAKWEVLNKRLLLTAATLHTNIRDEIEQNDNGTYSQYGRKRVEGYGLSIAGDITPTWQIIGGYTQQRATVHSDKDVAQDGPSSLPYTPKHAFTLQNQYQTTSDTSIDAGTRYVDSIHRGSDGVVSTPSYTGGCWTADAKLGCRVNHNLGFQLNVYSPSGTDYVSSINKSGYRYYPGESRAFLLTVNMHL